jgi:multidrug efflux system membrane fusion protein
LTSGIDAGDVVVIDGQDKLQDGSKVTTTLAGGSTGSGGAPSATTNAPGVPAKPNASPTSKSSRAQSGGSRR